SDLRDDDRDVSDLARLPKRASDPPRHLFLELSALRRQSQYRRALERQPALGRGGERGLPRRGAPVSHRVADHSGDGAETLARWRSGRNALRTIRNPVASRSRWDG